MGNTFRNKLASNSKIMSFYKLVRFLKTDYLWLRVLIGAVILCCFIYYAKVNTDPDMYWHISLGEQILRTHELPKLDTFSYTMQGYNWVDHEWLPEIGIYLLYSHNLWLIAVVLAALITFVPFATYLVRYKSLPMLLLTALAGLVVITYLSPRPQVFSFLFFFILIEILITVYIEKTKKISFLFLLPILFFFWANIHAGFFTGLATLGLFVFSSLVLSRNNILKRKENLWGFAILLICSIVVLINPYGARLYKEVFLVSFSPNVTKYIGEWISPLYTGGMRIAFFVGTFMAIVLIYRKKLPLHLVLTSVLLGIFFLKSSKAGVYFILSAVPLLAIGCEIIWQEAIQSRPNKQFSTRERLIGVILAVFALGAVLSGLIITTVKIKAPYEPEAITRFMKKQVEMKEKIVIFNTYSWGGYFIYNLPEVKVFVDGRMPHWRDRSGYSAMGEYVDVFYKEDLSRWREVFEKWEINEVVIYTGSTSFKESRILKNRSLVEGKILNSFYNDLHILKKDFDLAKALTDAGWTTIYKDDHGMILRKP